VRLLFRVGVGTETTAFHTLESATFVLYFAANAPNPGITGDHAFERKGRGFGARSGASVDTALHGFGKGGAAASSAGYWVSGDRAVSVHGSATAVGSALGPASPSRDEAATGNRTRFRFGESGAALAAARCVSGNCTVARLCASAAVHRTTAPAVPA